MGNVKTTEAGGPRGFDRRRKSTAANVMSSPTQSACLLGAEVHPADRQDRDGAPLVIAAIHDLFPWLRHLFADSA